LRTRRLAVKIRIAVALFFRFALLAMVIAACAPARFYAYSDGSRASTDEDAAWASSAALDDDACLDLGAPLAGVLWASAGAHPVALVGGSSFAVSNGTAKGLSPAPGVTGALFRPPRA
jgi:hypothetical protein